MFKSLVNTVSVPLKDTTTSHRGYEYVNTLCSNHISSILTSTFSFFPFPSFDLKGRVGRRYMCIYLPPRTYLRRIKNKSKHKQSIVKDTDSESSFNLTLHSLPPSDLKPNIRKDKCLYKVSTKSTNPFISLHLIHTFHLFHILIITSSSVYIPFLLALNQPTIHRIMVYRMRSIEL